ncbi:fatty-acyl-CoA synthase [Amycolatopsis xylanica]|uniref:Fatty-acyl-CoA synthase n=1 Tax=Amycolatopsis xylanica TaxID=589385 RepID=A0A1H2WB34_9PSEU|nr:PaaI family thioesterase [Amycolatopsis xylanica]SDW77761.1 fatty-acyl-CoA synthase [Amycolatopsis xylanica]
MTSVAELTKTQRYLDGLIAGTVPSPPVVERLLLPDATEWSPGSLTALVELTDEVTLTPGVVFGGYIGCLVDHFAGLVMMTVLPDELTFLTSEITISFRAPLRPGPARVEATVRRFGRRQAYVDIEFHQDGVRTGSASVEQILRKVS